MKVVSDFHSVPDLFLRGTVATLGNFDGMHPGHLVLVEKIIQLSKQNSLPSIIVSYQPNPAIVLGKNSNFKNIFGESTKEEIIANLGIDYLVNIQFTPEFAQIRAIDFVKHILLDKLNARSIVIGYNHYFGHNREGDYKFLKKHSPRLNYEVHKVEQVFYKEEKISSSLIRNYILEGNIVHANFLLNRDFFIRGTVVNGFQRGRTIGFPTANIELREDTILPPLGVYAAYTIWNDKRYKVMINIGKNPTFKNRDISIEGHILNFNEDIYGKEIDFYFVDKIREERSFSTIQALQCQLQMDKDFVQNSNYS